jgi:cellulose 1,4-beta-cellobiosidase
MENVSESMAAGTVLVMSIWDDHYANVLWYDSTYPTADTASGGHHGACAVTSGVPPDVESASPGASVTYSKIRLGPINSIFAAS